LKQRAALDKVWFFVVYCFYMLDIYIVWVYHNYMKKLIITGDWSGEPIYREESPEETLLRELQEAGLKEIVKVDLSELEIIKY
jgi:hypothetical protein